MLNGFKTPRRVVITGMGCVTPIGIGREAFWTALQRGESGVRRIESFDVSKSPVKIAAQVRDFDWQAELNAKDRKHVPRTVPLALAAAREAFADAGILTDELTIEERQRIDEDYSGDPVARCFSSAAQHHAARARAHHHDIA